MASRTSAGCLWQGGDVGASSIRRTCEHTRNHSRTLNAAGTESTARALDDAFDYGAFSSDYITNLLEARARTLPEPSALHLTRRADLLELELPQPDLSPYDPPEGPRDDTP